jgi:hypothetical protein
MVLISSAALSITFFSHPHRYTVLDDSLESSATNAVADSADTVDKILNRDEAADDWRRKAKTAGELSDLDEFGCSQYVGCRLVLSNDNSHFCF